MSRPLKEHVFLSIEMVLNEITPLTLLLEEQFIFQVSVMNLVPLLLAFGLLD